MSIPPSMDFASPMDETVTSIRSPIRTNGGSWAVTSTAAVLTEATSSPSIPRFFNTFLSEDLVSGDFLVSPGPCRPPTRPYPYIWFSFSPPMKERSFPFTETSARPVEARMRKRAVVMIVACFMILSPRELTQHLLQIIYDDQLFFLFGQHAAGGLVFFKRRPLDVDPLLHALHFKGEIRNVIGIDGPAFHQGRVNEPGDGYDMRHAAEGVGSASGHVQHGADPVKHPRGNGKGYLTFAGKLGAVVAIYFFCGRHFREKAGNGHVGTRRHDGIAFVAHREG